MSEVFYTPDNEPYLGRPSLHAFDEALIEAFSVCRTLAPLTRAPDLSELELAVIDLVPTSVSIAASIRELIRQSYIPAAKILARPLLERAAVVNYIVNDNAGLQVWFDGWDRKRRPKLREMLELMSGMEGADAELIRFMIDDYNSVVHAEPTGSRKFISSDAAGKPIYSPSRTFGVEDLVDDVSMASFMALTFLCSNSKRAFRDRIVREGSK